MRIGFMLAAAGLACAAPLAGQATYETEDASGLVGHWTGTIEEPESEVPHYTLSVHIDTDEHGHPVGVVHYAALPCTGVWSDGVRDGADWRFSETITEAGTRCAKHVIVVLTPDGDGYEVRLWQDGFAHLVSRGRLSRQP